MRVPLRSRRPAREAAQAPGLPSSHDYARLTASPIEGARIGAGAIALFVILALLSAYLSLMFWILGVGVPRSSHNAMGLLFVAINASCVGGGTWFLRKGQRLAALGLVIASLPLGIGALVIAVSIFHV